jgi:tRNA G10  N-methylase Trm11
VLDPLAGGGTTIFSAAALGASAIGIEKSSEDVHGAVTFLKQFLREAELDFQEREERLKGVGRRWRFDLGAQHCVFAAGESADCVKLLNGFKKSHVIVTDLPYGIQHRGTLTELLALSLPAWHAVLEPGGAMVFSWDATRVRRESMVAAVHEALPAVRICAGGAYDMLAHPVDRVIKRRDMLVLRLSESP